MKKIIKSTIIVSFAILVTTLLASVFVVKSVDYDSYRKLIIEEVKKITGREFNCSSSISLKISLEPEISLSNITLNNAPWGKDRNMIEVDQVKVKMSLIPLLKGNIVINTIIFDGLSLWLETDESGQGNWHFSSKDKEMKQNNTSESILPVIHLIAVKNSLFHFFDGQSNKLHDYNISFLLTNTTTPGHPLKIVSDIVYNKIPLTVNGDFGSVSQLISGKPFPIKINGTSNNDSISLDGMLNPANSESSFHIDFDLKGQNLADLAPLVEMNLHPLGPYSASGLIEKPPNDFKINNMNIFVNESDLSGNLILNLNKKIPIIKGKLFSNHLAINYIWPPAVNESKDDIGDNNADESISVKEFDLSFLDAVDLDLSISSNRVLYSDLILDDVMVVGNLTQGNLALNQLSLKINGAKVESTVVATSKSNNYSFTITAEGENISDFLSPWDIETKHAGPYSIASEIDLKSQWYGFSNLKINIDQSNLSGDLTLNLHKNKPEISAKLSSTLISVDDFWQNNQEAGADKDIQDLKHNEKLFSKKEFDFSFLKAVDLDLSLFSEKILYNNHTFSDITVKSTIDSGNLVVDSLTFNIEKSKVTSKFSVTDKSDIIFITSAVKADQLPFGKLLNNYNIYNKIEGGNLDIFFDLKGEGNSISTLLAGLEGKLFLNIIDSKINDSAIDYAGADLITELFQKINPFEKEDAFTQIECGVLNLIFKDGQSLSDKSFGLETGKMNVIGGGLINLESEYLDISIKPKPKKGLGISMGSVASLVKLQGPLNAPETKLDKMGVAKGAASIGMAFATGGLSLLGEAVLGKITADSSPCKTVMEYQ